MVKENKTGRQPQDYWTDNDESLINSNEFEDENFPVDCRYIGP